MKLKKRFYVAAESISDGDTGNWTHQRVEQAITHAKCLMEEDGRDQCYIVQIIKVVKRAKLPVRVETVTA